MFSFLHVAIDCIPFCFVAMVAAMVVAMVVATVRQGLITLGNLLFQRSKQGPRTPPLRALPAIIQVAPFQPYILSNISQRVAKMNIPIPDPQTATPVAKALRFSK